MTEDNKGKLGEVGKDKITGFTGVITGVAIYLHSTARVEVTSKQLTTDGKTQMEWFDDERVEIVEAGGG